MQMSIYFEILWLFPNDHVMITKVFGIYAKTYITKSQRKTDISRI